MANWYGSARSNYFRVKDRSKFLAWAEELGLTVMHAKDGSGLFGIHPGDTEDGDWPAPMPLNEGGYEIDDAEPRYVAHELQQHLADGEVAVLKVIGAEKLRYLTAYAIVTTPTTIEAFDLDDIVRDKYPSATACEY